MNRTVKSFLATAKSWLAEHDLHGPHAFLRFVMLVFVQRLNEVTDEFVFKGGNLLWLYIKTPRATVDVDFVTRSLADHEKIRQKLEEACQGKEGSIQFSVHAFTPIDRAGVLGASVRIRYVTSEGQQNTFDLDIVYAIPTSAVKIQSPIGAEDKISVTTMENIIADKLSACQRFKSGNTRLKDFDDLWRISIFLPNPVSWVELKEILNSRAIAPSLDLGWLNPQMERSWQSHVKRNKGLPENLADAMTSVNSWLTRGLKD